MNAHEFALYFQELPKSTAAVPKELTLADAELVHRMQQVLRCQKGQTILLFNKVIHVVCVIKDFSKKAVIMERVTAYQNKQVQPFITVLLPLLKREAFDEALYACCELGVTAIQLIVTRKCSRQTLSLNERERIDRVMKAAAEQSKQFMFPQVLNDGKVLTIEQFFAESKTKQLLHTAIALRADCYGSLQKEQLVTTVQKADSFVLAFGPEGDFIQEETELLQREGFVGCSLGPTVLRSQQAVAVFVGLVRVLR